jgi:hypothetical protein
VRRRAVKTARAHRVRIENRLERTGGRGDVNPRLAGASASSASSEAAVRGES